MGGCTSMSKNVEVPKVKKENIDPRLNRWNSRQIHLLKHKFKESIQNKKILALTKKEFLNIFPQLKFLPKIVIESAFKLFDEDKSGDIDFREFCYILSLICLSDVEEKLRFIFGLFDVNRNNYLTITELTLLLKSLLILYKVYFNNYQKGQDTILLNKEEKNWVEKTSKELSEKNSKIVFESFQDWAGENINVFWMLNIFELVPSAVKENEVMNNAFKNIQKKTGDVWYIISYRWWEMWQIYIKYNTETLIHSNYNKVYDKNIKVSDDLLYKIVYEFKRSQLGGEVIRSETFHCYTSRGNSKRETPGRESPQEEMSPKPVRRLPDKLKTIHQSLGGPPLRKTSVINSEPDDSPYPQGTTSDDRWYRSSIKQFSNIVGERPAEIDNSDLEGENKGQLKLNLIHKRDYILVPEEGWNNLVSWYGGGPKFARRVIMTGKTPTIELYPPKIFISLCIIVWNKLIPLGGVDGKPLADSSGSFFVSNVETMEEISEKMKQHYQMKEKFIRLWFKSVGDEWIKLEKMQESVEDLGVRTGDTFMLEMKFNNIWPKDEKPQNAKDWEDFEVGDKIDININRFESEWKVGQIVKVHKEKIKVHIENTNYKNDIVLPKGSNHIKKYGSKTLATHLKTIMSMQMGMTPKDLVGLNNLGNTCYMNSVLQCILSIKLIRHYFKSNLHQIDLNKRNIFAEGNLAIATSALVKEYNNTKNINIYPRAFKKVINKQIPLFFGYEQHDAQEFLSFFLDYLSEDLNRIKKKEIIRGSDSPLKGGDKSVSKIPATDTAIRAKSKFKSGSDRKLKEKENEKEREILGVVKEKEKDTLDLKEEEKEESKVSVQSEKRKLSERNENNVERKSESLQFGSSAKDKEEETTTNPENQLFTPQKQNTSPQFIIDGEPKTKIEQAEDSWKEAESTHSSVINDLFGGQICTSILCPKCQTHSYNFQKFYTLSVPVPIGVTNTYTINVVRRCSEDSIPPIMKYGITINKKANLGDLYYEVGRVTNLRKRNLHLIELYMNKIYKVFVNDPKTPLKQLGLRTNTDLYAYEIIKTLEDAQAIVPFKETRSHIRDDRPQPNPFRPGGLIDAEDQDGKWRVGKIVDEFSTKGREGKNKIYLKVQFTESIGTSYAYGGRMQEKMFDYFEKSSDKIAPYKTHTRDNNMIILWNVVQRINKAKKNTSTYKRNSRYAYNYFETLGLPFVLGIGTWFTWRNVFYEIALQAYRFVKNKDEYLEANQSIWKETEVDASIPAHKDGDKIRFSQYGSAQFASHKAKVEMRTDGRGRSENLSKREDYSGRNKKQGKKSANDKYKNKNKRSGMRKDSDSDSNSMSYSNSEDVDEPESYSDYGKKFTQFKIKILDEHTGQCAFCTARNFKAKDSLRRVNCAGCLIPINDNPIKDIVQFFGRVTVYIEWNNLEDFAPQTIASDVSVLMMQEEEKKRLNGYSLEKCFDLFTKKEKLQEFECEKCNSVVEASVQSSLSKVPDFLIIHLKRFAFEDNFLEKLQTFINFPLTNLNLSDWIMSPKNRNTAENLYDLYAVANHLSYSTVGGHYTSFILYSNTTQSVLNSLDINEERESCANKWYCCDDDLIKEIKTSSIVTKDAYILFYKRKCLSASNIINLTYQSFQ